MWLISAGTSTRGSGTFTRFRSGIGCLLPQTGDGDVEQGIDGGNVCFRILDADEVLIGTLRVDPEVLLVELDAGIERRHDVLHHVRLIQPEADAFAWSTSSTYCG